MNNNGYFHYPDGTDSDTPPVDGQICRVESHKRGKFVDYIYDEESNEWLLLPKNRTPEAVIDATKKILKIGKYYGDRPVVEHRYGHGYNWEEIFPFADRPYAEHARLIESGWDPTTGEWIRDDERDPVSVYQRSALMPSILPTQTIETRYNPASHAYETGSFNVPCECGVIYCMEEKEHYTWCPRHPSQAWRYSR